VSNQFQQTAHVLTHGVLLLTGKDNSRVRFMLRHVARMEAIEIPDIETAQYAPLGRGKLEMIRVRAFNHLGFESGLHVDSTGSERVDQSMPQGIFVKVEANRHGVFR
jgi:hypothetical protein